MIAGRSKSTDHSLNRLYNQGGYDAILVKFDANGTMAWDRNFCGFFDDAFTDIVATADGSRGVKGFVTDAMPEDYDYFYTCGPMPMFKAIEKKVKTSGQYSFEERMGCGFGACMGCSCKTKYGSKRICKDGPVLVREEIIW